MPTVVVVIEPLRCAGFPDKELKEVDDPPPFSPTLLAAPWAGCGGLIADIGTSGLFSMTTAVGPREDEGVLDCSSGLLEPASSREGQPMGSVFLLSRSSRAFSARCLWVYEWICACTCKHMYLLRIFCYATNLCENSNYSALAGMYRPLANLLTFFSEHPQGQSQAVWAW